MYCHAMAVAAEEAVSFYAGPNLDVIASVAIASPFSTQRINTLLNSTTLCSNTHRFCSLLSTPLINIHQSWCISRRLPFDRYVGALCP